ncbi:MAG: RDD family protein [Limnohabitans sp.]|nr:RDD family protein [Limnohabitans sp.]
MKKINPKIFTIGFIILMFFGTPIRYEMYDPFIRHRPFFTSGFIDYSRLILYLGFIFCISYLSNFLNFSFLKNFNITLFIKKIISRIIDISLISSFSTLVMLLFDITLKSEVLAKLILTPLFTFILWIFYFVFFFSNGKTYGDLALKLETITITNSKDISKKQLFLKEFIYTLPIFIFFISTGIINYISENYVPNFKENYIGYIVYTIPFMITSIIILPLTTIFNNNEGVIERWTKIKTVIKS